MEHELLRQLNGLRSKSDFLQRELDGAIKERDEYRKTSAKLRTDNVKLRMEFATLSSDFAAAQTNVDTLKSERTDTKRNIDLARIQSDGRTLLRSVTPQHAITHVGKAVEPQAIQTRDEHPKIGKAVIDVDSDSTPVSRLVAPIGSGGRKSSSGDPAKGSLFPVGGGDQPSTSAQSLAKSTRLYSSPRTVQNSDRIPVQQPAATTKDASSVVTGPPSRSIIVSRQFISQKYGGSSQALFAKIYQYNPLASPLTFLFPNPAQNPNLPTKPGASGDMLFVSKDIQEMSPVILFAKVPKLGPNMQCWELLGTYALSLKGAVPFDQLSVSIQRVWAAELRNKCRYVEERARIRLRKLKRTVTTESVLEEVNKEGKEKMNSRDIMNALSRGEEKIAILRLHYLGYDDDLAKHMADKWEQYNLEDSQKKTAEQTKAGDSAMRKKKRTRRGREIENEDCEEEYLKRTQMPGRRLRQRNSLVQYFNEREDVSDWDSASSYEDSGS